MQGAGPLPVLGVCYQTAIDRVAMNVAELLCSLVGTPHVEIVIAGLPERTLAAADRNGELKRLNRSVEGAGFWLVDEQVNVLGHDDVCEYEEFIPLPDSFKCGLEEVAA
jgi:hypothetical protein